MLKRRFCSSQQQKIRLEVRRADGRRRPAGAVPPREPGSSGGRGLEPAAPAARQPGAPGEGGAQAEEETPQQAEEAAPSAVQRPLGANGGEVRETQTLLTPHTCRVTASTSVSC